MLTAYWFELSRGLGYGVTARSREDAELLLRDFGYPREGEVVARVIEGIAFAQLDSRHVVPNAGPLVLRGVWYPRHNLAG